MTNADLDRRLARFAAFLLEHLHPEDGSMGMDHDYVLDSAEMAQAIVCKRPTTPGQCAFRYIPGLRRRALQLRRSRGAR